jgi:DNA-binding transcriptional LysR family regulator
VAAVESVSTYVLPPRLASMRERWPSARFKVFTATCDDIRELVAAGKCDIGLIIEADSGTNDDAALAKARLAICADPAHPLARHAVSADRLVSWDFYMSDAGGSYHEVLRQYFKAAEFALPRMQTLGTIEGVKRGLNAEKTAIGVLPAHAVERELLEGALVEIILEPALPGLMLKSVRMPNHGLPLVEDLIARLRASSSAAELHAN